MKFTASLSQTLSLLVFTASIGGVVSFPTTATPNTAAEITRVIDFETYMAELATGNVNSAAKVITERAPAQQGNVLVCVAANFAGCVLITNVPSGTCVPLGSDLNDFVSSFGPDPDQQCFVFHDFGCTGTNRGPIEFPGVSDFSQSFFTSDGRLNDPFNDQISSYQCFNTI
ncbi:hypothetical protein D9758_004965 [Tetrapyrgos nigripes]|uniref:Uncharacterized protein n=1 Tax=Tetrapyrgos nigripes TaxID=182062 RepID=A0A8H5GW53_9AGAR|nr:hypothetical protein D9758_004965 [Tetrapyrgos nigripes]